MSEPYIVWACNIGFTDQDIVEGIDAAERVGLSFDTIQRALANNWELAVYRLCCLGFGPEYEANSLKFLRRLAGEEAG